jgi:hypothetical protein
MQMQLNADSKYAGKAYLNEKGLKSILRMGELEKI